MPLDDDYAALFDRVPVGWSEVLYAGRRYGLTRTIAAEGRAMTVYAEELGGRDVVSANLYLTAAGAQLRACEMPDAKVVDFLTRFELIARDPAPG
jgi:peptide-methionine (S)-S-oxide reductase